MVSPRRSLFLALAVTGINAINPVTSVTPAAPGPGAAAAATVATKSVEQREPVERRRRYVNPVSRSFADTFADPAVIRARDGFWYAYGTSDPLRSRGRKAHLIPIARSRDLTSWAYVGDVFTARNRPSWAAADSAFWAPDIRYLAGRYHLYFVATQTTLTAEPNDNAIGVATSPSPAGPWIPVNAPVIAPRRGPGGWGDFKWTFDPALLTAVDGRRYLYYGSHHGGIWVTRLSTDGLRAVGKPTLVAMDTRYEGAYVVRRGAFYYLFVSVGDCCAGPATAYSTFVGRSRHPRGPFVDAAGIPLTSSRTGGTIVISPNGNRWVGTGHMSIATDLSGQDWLVYHAVDQNRPYLNKPYGINRRAMLVDRLDWINGWPTVRAGAWASDTPQLAPVSEPGVARASLAARDSSCVGEATLVDGVVPANLRIRAVIRGTSPARAGAAGLVIAGGAGDRLTVWLDRGERAMVAEEVRDGQPAARSVVPLPASFAHDDWHELAVEVRKGVLTAWVSSAGVHDPLAELIHPFLAFTGDSPRVGVAARCGLVQAADFTAAPLHNSVTHRVPPPSVGRLDPAYSDDFAGSALTPAWSWVGSPAGEVRDGAYLWTVRDGALDEGSTASLLLRDAPPGDYTVETKVTTALPAVRGYQQAGLVAYLDDASNLRLNHVAIGNTRHTEFAKQMPYAGGLSFGSMTVGAPGETTWLRLVHRVDPGTGKHLFRGATSTDGSQWTWGGTWTLPAGSAPRIGLVSVGGPGATARFHWFRVHR